LGKISALIRIQVTVAARFLRDHQQKWGRSTLREPSRGPRYEAYNRQT